MCVRERENAREMQCDGVSCSMLQCVAVCCSVLQYVAVCCRVLQGVAEYSICSVQPNNTLIDRVHRVIAR